MENSCRWTETGNDIPGQAKSTQARAPRVWTATAVQRQKPEKGQTPGWLTAVTRTPCPVTPNQALTPLGGTNRVLTAENREWRQCRRQLECPGGISSAKGRPAMVYAYQKVPQAPHPHTKPRRKWRPNGISSAMIHAKDSKHTHTPPHTPTCTQFIETPRTVITENQNKMELEKLTIPSPHLLRVPCFSLAVHWRLPGLSALLSLSLSVTEPISWFP